ncbi:beta-lactamase family protein [bacterium]|nr:beta-lactamase family protein [bacterium]MBU1063272.1 beta-lactamase family protein [bacterium]MBU1634676.1 beta-lactamase family protein [bacterium]MBU1872293.1 beta-lactamase family protein [bacterium]
MNIQKSMILMVPIVLSSIFLTCDSDENGPSAPQLSENIAAQIDWIVDSVMTADNLPGVCIDIRIPDQGNYIKAYGLANLTGEIPRTVNDPFRAASITKSMVATVILTLVDDGLLNASDPVSDYLPDFPNGETITVRNLLRMRSGIVDYADEEMLAEWYAEPTKEYVVDSLIALSAAQHSNFSLAGNQTVYCNVNYSILGCIAEQVTGKPIRDLLQERIFNVLGMNDSFYPEYTDISLDGTNHGYCRDSSTGDFVDKTELNTSCGNSAGAVISTLADLQVFACALYSGMLLSEATQQSRLEAIPFAGSPEFIGYGEGIMKLSHFWGHNGTIFGFSSEMFYLPEEDATIIISVNRLDLDDHSQSTYLFLLLSRELFPDYVDW